MNKDYKNSDVRTAMYEQLNLLMKEGASRIQNKNGAELYSLSTHYYLMENAWEIMFPLKQEFWPDKFNDHLADSNLPWPQGSTYSYIMSVICPPFISWSNLYFGYAVLDGKLIRTTFFAIETLVDYQTMPQAMVIDPLCLAHGINPDYYIGCCAEKKDIDNFLIMRKNPLDLFVDRKQKEAYKERMFDSYMDAYNLQMFHAPGYFPDKLLKFAKENNLSIPPQERTFDDL